MTGARLLRSCLMDRITRSLFLSREFKADLKGLCWDGDDVQNSRHVGIMFQIEIDNPHTTNDLRKKEFRKMRGRGHNLAGQFIDWNEIKKRRKDIALEPWSEAILLRLADFLGT